MALLTAIEATHNITTKNLNTYQVEHFPTSVKSWKKPYKKPVLLHHNSYSGTPVGRVQKAEHTDSVIKKNLDAQRLIVKITNEQIAQGVLDGTYTTLSIGGSAKSAICSICKTDILDAGWCGHLKGRKYDNKVCTWLVGPMEYEEVSFVNVPADPYAQVVIPDLEAEAKGKGESAELAKQLLREYREEENNERRTEGVAKTAAELANEIEEQINNLNNPSQQTESDNSNEPQNEPAPTQESNQNVDYLAQIGGAAESLKTKIGEINDSNKPSDEVLKDAALVMESLVKFISGEITMADFVTSLGQAPEGGITKEAFEQMETRATTAEAALTAAQGENKDLQQKLETANNESAPLKQQVEQSQKLAQSVAKLARMVAVDRVVDLTIVVDGKSPNDREGIAQGLAEKQLSDLVADGQALAEKLPIPQRTPGNAEKEGADEGEFSESANGEDNNTSANAAKVAEAMVAIFSGRKSNK